MKTFRELLADFLLVEMAFDKKTMENKIRKYENKINTNLIKIIRYKDEEKLEDIILDVMILLAKVQTLNFGKHRKFSKDLYFKLLFEEPITDSTNTDYIKGLEKLKLKDYSTLPIIRNEVETMIELENIQKEISRLLSQNSVYDIEFRLLQL